MNDEGQTHYVGDGCSGGHRAKPLESPAARELYDLKLAQAIARECRTLASESWHVAWKEKRAKEAERAYKKMLTNRRDGLLYWIRHLLRLEAK